MFYPGRGGRGDRLAQPGGPEHASRYVSRRVKAAAYAVPLCVLPSALWRLHAVFVKDFPLGCEGLMGAWEPVYVASLSAVSLAASLLTIVLVGPWGEVVPGWVPFLGGRVVPVSAAVIPDGAGDTRTPTVINLFVYWLWEIPLGYLLAKQFGLGPHGVFWAVTIAFSSLAVVSAAVFRRGGWKRSVV